MSKNKKIQENLNNFKLNKDFSYAMSLYSEICNRLNLRYREQIRTTHAENIVLAQILTKTKVHFERSVWIGTKNIDLFTYSLMFPEHMEEGYRKVNYGLAIEVNGFIHDKEFKMKKDNEKEDFLKKMGIIPYVINNEDINKKHHKRALDKLLTAPKTDSKTRKRFKFRVFHHTIMSNLDTVYTIFNDKSYYPKWKSELISKWGL